MKTRAFSIVELLIVIAIIGLLLALLLPALAAVREGARRAQCANHLRQIALGTLSYASARQDRLPAFHTRVRGAPRRAEHASWRYAILPFLEEQTLHDNFRYDEDEQLTDAAVHAIKSNIDVYQCPSTPGALRSLTGLTHRFGRRDASVQIAPRS